MHTSNLSKCTHKAWAFIYMYILPVVGFGCCAGFSLVSVSGGCFLVEVHGLLFLQSMGSQAWAQVASLQALEHGLSSCDAWASWHVASSQTEIEPMSPALASRFLSTVPPGKSTDMFIIVTSS